MLIALAIGPLFIHQGDRVEGVAVDGGFLHVTSRGDDTRVDILAEHAELESEIDVAAASVSARRRAAGRAGQRREGEPTSRGP